MTPTQTKASRRGFFLTASAAGALAASAALRKTPDVTALADLPKPPPEKGGGYSLSEHVKHYYRTTRV